MFEQGFDYSSFKGPWYILVMMTDGSKIQVVGSEPEVILVS